MSKTPRTKSDTRDRKRAADGPKSKAATLARKKARAAKYARQGR